MLKRRGEGMDVVTRKDILRFVKPQNNYIVSIYLPTHKTAVIELREDELRYKNLLIKAEEHLHKLSPHDKAMKKQLAAAHHLIGDEEFWRNQSHGLAIFISPKKITAYRLPVGFKEVCTVSKRYHIKPLLRLWDEEEHFYILTASLKKVRLFRATQTQIRPVISKTLPKDINDALGYDDNERQLQFHSQGAARGLVFHGHGGAKDLSDVDPPRFIRAVAKGIDYELKNSQAPLVFAGVDELFALYRDIRKRTNLAGHLSGNHDETELYELHAKAMEVVRPLFEASQVQDLERYHQLAATTPERVVTDSVSELLEAAHQGKVDTLLMIDDAYVWGEETAGQLTKTNRRQLPGDVDLLDSAAAYTVSNSGTVHILKNNNPPAEVSQAVAILRY